MKFKGQKAGDQNCLNFCAQTKFNMRKVFVFSLAVLAFIPFTGCNQNTKTEGTSYTEDGFTAFSADTLANDIKILAGIDQSA